MRFTSTARRSGRWWVVQCDQHPGAISQVARLDQAVAHQREAIAFVADLDEADVEVEVRPELPEGAEQDLAAALRFRNEAEHSQLAATRHWHAAARQLSEFGLTVRDIGVILGVSYQRAHQLLSAEHEQRSGRAF